MQEAKRNIHINAPVKEIFEYLKNPEHLVEIWPNTPEISEVERSPIKGSRFRWAHHLANTRFEGWGECVHSIPEKRITYVTTGGMLCRMTFTMSPGDDGVNVALHLTYDAHAPWYYGDWEAVLRRECRADAEAMLQALKARMEAGRGAAIVKGNDIERSIVLTP
ncbi:MAG: SRPBCC family protein [Chloroflexota bacterium]